MVYLVKQIIFNNTTTKHLENNLNNKKTYGTRLLLDEYIITNNYGIYIANQIAGSNNYSIYSAGGFNYLGGPLQVANTISADYTGSNIRLKGGGTGTTDGGIYVNGIGNIFFADWDGTRGFVTKGDGKGYYFGGNFGVGTATPDYNLDIIGTFRTTQSAVIGYSTIVSPPTNGQQKRQFQ